MILTQPRVKVIDQKTLDEEPPKYGPYDEVDYINDDFAKRFPDSILPQLKQGQTIGDWIDD